MQRRFLTGSSSTFSARRDADGQVRLALRQPWADGTTHVVLDPVEFLGRLAVLARPMVTPRR